MELSLLAQSFSWFDPASWLAILKVVLGIGAVIFVHELGHFLVAKACGVKCEKFYVGFDAFDIKIGDRVLVPRKLLHFQWGETEYGVGILPLGGYVKMLGQDDNPAKMAEERERSMMEGAEEPKIDPRSYQAKTVPQRMAIISAGVVMNLIFAVIFAAIAFRIGVNYEPPIVGSTTPGSPAWQNSLEGSQILSVNGNRSDDKYYTFAHLREAIVLGGLDGALQVELVRPGETESETVTIEPVRGLINIKGGENLLAIGIAPMTSSKIGIEDPIIVGQACSLAEPPFFPGDEIVEVQGMPVTNGFDLRRALAHNADINVTMKVKRVDSDGNEKYQGISVPANPMRLLGIEMKFGPIRAIREGSPAAIAGMKVGDRIVKINGENPGPAVTLQQRMLIAAKHVDDEKRTVKFTVERKDGDNTSEIDLDVIPVLPNTTSTFVADHGLTIDSLGINIPVSNVVAVSNVADGENALKSGDRIIHVTFVPSEEQADNTYIKLQPKEFDLKEYPDSWGSVHSVAQIYDEGSKVQIKYERDETTYTTELRVIRSDEWFQEARGMALQLERNFYQDENVWAAIQTGFMQTVYDATRVLNFLKKLVHGQLSVKQFGGPGTIAVVATSEATHGTSRLLLFLTLLSANLAIINFLPIPILDGGHMVFLMYEGIFRRPVNEKVQFALTVAGLIFILGLMLTVISLDIWRMT